MSKVPPEVPPASGWPMVAEREKVPPLVVLPPLAIVSHSMENWALALDAASSAGIAMMPIRNMGRFLSWGGAENGGLKTRGESHALVGPNSLRLSLGLEPIQALLERPDERAVGVTGRLLLLDRLDRQHGDARVIDAGGFAFGVECDGIGQHARDLFGDEAQVALAPRGLRGLVVPNVGYRLEFHQVRTPAVHGS